MPIRGFHLTTNCQSPQTIRGKGVCARRRSSGSEPSIVGVKAVEDLRRFHFDISFLGVSGLAEDGFYDYSIEETEIKAAMVSQSKRNIVLMDSSRIW